MTKYVGLSFTLLLVLCISGCAGSQPVPPKAAVVDSPTAIPSPTSLPPSLVGRYYLGAFPNLLNILPDGFAYYSTGQFTVENAHYIVNGDKVTFTDESCGDQAGVYRWSLQQDLLKLSPINDPCTSRAGRLAQNLKKLPEQLPFVLVDWEKSSGLPDNNLSTVDSAGNFYITDGTSGFYKYNPDGSSAQSWPNMLSYTVGITVDGQGNIYVSNFDDATIHKYDAQGHPLLSWKVNGGKIGPVGIAHDSQGNIYVALHRLHDHYIEKYSPEGKLLGTWVNGYGNGDGQVGAASNRGPEDVAVDSEGNSYISDPLNNRVVKFDPNGKFLYNLTGDGNRKLVEPGIVTVDSNGNVYIMSSLATIWKFDKAGKFAGEWFAPFEDNIVIDSKDNIYLVGSHIAKIELPDQ